MPSVHLTLKDILDLSMSKKGRANLARNIKFYREKRGFTQMQMAIGTKMSHPTYWKFENMPDGFSPTLKKIEAIAAFLGVTESQLFADKEPG